MASSTVKTKLETARRFLEADRVAPEPVPARRTDQEAPQSWQDLVFAITGIDLFKCPRCTIGTMVRRPVFARTGTIDEPRPPPVR
jgi:hypothetical protein